MKKLKKIVYTLVALLLTFTACDEESKKETGDLAKLSTINASEITQNTAKTGGRISDNGGTPLIEKGVCWSSSQNPTTNDEKLVNDSEEDDFECMLTSLSTGTNYYVRAYAINGTGTAYGNEISFTTLPEGTTSNEDEGEENTNTGEEQTSTGEENTAFNWGRIEPSLWGSWRNVAISGDNNFIYAAAYGSEAGRLYVSGDMGAQWVELMPAGNVTHKWNALAVCYTGQNIVVGGASGRLYHSTNYGIDWTELQLMGDEDRHWKSAAMSDDGSVIVVTTLGGVFVSTNSGNDWTKKLPDEYESYSASAVSADGQIIYVAKYDARIYKSENSGDSWEQLTSAGSSSWRTLSTSTNGKILLACSDAKLMLSKNKGETWEDIKPSIEYYSDFYGACMSDNGQTILLADRNGKVRASGNKGKNWVVTEPINGENSWTYPAISRDGSFCLLPEAFYRLFIGSLGQ